MKAIELVKNAIEEYGFRIVECDELTIMFRYQLNPILARVDEDDRFVALIMARAAEVDEEERFRYLEICNELNKEVKQVKAYLGEEEYVVLSSEFFYEHDEDVRAFVRYGLHLLSDTKKRLAQCMRK